MRMVGDGGRFKLKRAHEKRRVRRWLGLPTSTYHPLQ